MYKSYVPYLQHILDECLYVRSVIKDDMQKEEFLRDETLKTMLKHVTPLARQISSPRVSLLLKKQENLYTG